MVWLHAYSTNNNPKIIASYFIAEVEKRMGTAARICADFGTENVTMVEMQIFLRWSMEHHISNSYISGSSTNNQRIESWWGFLRTHHAQYWMNRFQELKDWPFLRRLLGQATCIVYLFEHHWGLLGLSKTSHSVPVCACAWEILSLTLFIVWERM